VTVTFFAASGVERGATDTVGTAGANGARTEQDWAPGGLPGALVFLPSFLRQPGQGRLCAGQCRPGQFSQAKKEPGAQLFFSSDGHRTVRFMTHLRKQDRPNTLCPPTRISYEPKRHQGAGTCGGKVFPCQRAGCAGDRNRNCWSSAGDKAPVGDARGPGAELTREKPADAGGNRQPHSPGERRQPEERERLIHSFGETSHFFDLNSLCENNVPGPHDYAA
jgi:hypothetical protein